MVTRGTHHQIDMGVSMLTQRKKSIIQLRDTLNNYIDEVVNYLLYITTTEKVLPSKDFFLEDGGDAGQGVAHYIRTMKERACLNTAFTISISGRGKHFHAGRLIDEASSLGIAVEETDQTELNVINLIMTFRLDNPIV